MNWVGTDKNGSLAKADSLTFGNIPNFSNWCFTSKNNVARYRGKPFCPFEIDFLTNTIGRIESNSAIRNIRCPNGYEIARIYQGCSLVLAINNLGYFPQPALPPPAHPCTSFICSSMNFCISSFLGSSNWYLETQSLLVIPARAYSTRA